MNTEATMNEENRRMAHNLHALRIATIRGSLEDVKSSLANGLTVNQPLKGGWTALMYACSMGHPNIVEYLLKQGANPNFHKELFTPLMAACASTQKNEEHLVHCVDLLLHYKANVNMTERHHISALMFAAKEGHTKIVERLLTGNSQCDMDAQDSQGWTALFWAVNQKRAGVVEVLIRKGAKTNVRDICGQTVLDLAASKGCDQIMNSLMNKSIKPFDSLEDNKLRDLSDSNRKKMFPNGTDSMLQALAEELSSPVINNKSRCTNSFAKLFNNMEFENHVDVLQAHKIISKIANSVNSCLLNPLLFSQNLMPKQKKSIETTLKNIPYSALEAREVLIHTVRQLEYLYASISYTRLHMQASWGPVLVEDKHARNSEIIALSEKACYFSRLLHDEVSFLNRYAKQMEDREPVILADVITERAEASHSSVISHCIVAAAVVVILFNTRTITLSFFSK